MHLPYLQLNEWFFSEAKHCACFALPNRSISDRLITIIFLERNMGRKNPSSFLGTFSLITDWEGVHPAEYTNKPWTTNAMQISDRKRVERTFNKELTAILNTLKCNLDRYFFLWLCLFMLFALTLTFIHVLNNEIFNSGFLLERRVSGILPFFKILI